MDISKIFDLPDEKIWSVIRRRYNENPNEIEKHITKFKNWLGTEPHLPNDIDEHFIRNFIRHQGSNLDKIKEVFEDYLVSRTRIRDFIQGRHFNQEHFRNKIYKFLVPTKHLTPEGYRTAILKIPSGIENEDFEEMIRYVLVLGDLVLSLDSCAGYVIVYFLENVTLDLADKINIELLKEAVNMFYNVEPVRVINVHLVNAPEIPEAIRNTMEKYVKPDFMRKICVHENPTTLKDYLPDDMIPQEYGGSLENLDEVAENMKNFLDDNRKWIRGLPGSKSNEFPPQKPRLFDLENLQKNPNIDPPFIN